MLLQSSRPGIASARHVGAVERCCFIAKCSTAIGESANDELDIEASALLTLAAGDDLHLGARANLRSPPPPGLNSAGGKLGMRPFNGCKAGRGSRCRAWCSMRVASGLAALSSISISAVNSRTAFTAASCVGASEVAAITASATLAATDESNSSGDNHPVIVNSGTSWKPCESMAIASWASMETKAVSTSSAWLGGAPRTKPCGAEDGREGTATLREPEASPPLAPQTPRRLPRAAVAPGKVPWRPSWPWDRKLPPLSSISATRPRASQSLPGSKQLAGDRGNAPGRSIGCCCRTGRRDAKNSSCNCRGCC
mmetsp:Transcript_108881/g.306836  ORF Transcript_108881/g.306836 Transcript_108881/m.306836 type:complete len:311 (-) Transcript_108881:1280-2212(-)